MSFFDELRTKVDEFLGGGVEDVTGKIEEVSGQATDLADQAQQAKDDILPGGEK